MKTFSFFSFTDSLTPRGTETLDQTLVTIPDMSLSVKDILLRFRRGTLDVSSLIRRSDDLELDIDDNRFDGIDDISDLDSLRRSVSKNVYETIQRQLLETQTLKQVNNKRSDNVDDAKSE